MKKFGILLMVAGVIVVFLSALGMVREITAEKIPQLMIFLILLMLFYATLIWAFLFEHSPRLKRISQTIVFTFLGISISGWFIYVFSQQNQAILLQSAIDLLFNSSPFFVGLILYQQERKN